MNTALNNDPSKTGSGRFYIEKRVFMQYIIIHSMVFASWMWILLSVALFWISDDYSFLSIRGISFMFAGLFFVSDIIGVGIFLSNKAYAIIKFNKNGRIPSKKKLKKVYYIINAIWTPILILSAHYSFGLFHDLFDSLTTMPS